VHDGLLPRSALVGVGHPLTELIVTASSTAATLMSIGPDVTGSSASAIVIFGAAVKYVVDMTEAKAGILAR